MAHYKRRYPRIRGARRFANGWTARGKTRRQRMVGMTAEELDRMQLTALQDESPVGEEALTLIDEVRRLGALVERQTLAMADLRQRCYRVEAERDEARDLAREYWREMHTMPAD